MARGVNEHIVIGNFGADPELRYTPSGSAVANMTIATGRSWKDKKTGETVEATDWHRVVFFSRLAEIVNQYCKQGSQVYVRGDSRTRKYTDKEGVVRYATEIFVKDLKLLGKAPIEASLDDQDESEGGFQEYANMPG